MDVNMASSRLANQAMSVGGEKISPDALLIDDGVVPAFGRSKEFQNVMNPNVMNPNLVNSVGSSVGRNGFWKPKPVQRVTPGEGVLNMVQNARDAYKEIEKSINKLTIDKNGANFSTANLMELQWQVMQLSYINELSSKVADKTSQGAQTLFRNQG
ncbi:MAG: EscI/YscI/HrpB family type III secretion system inner rod protein [Puniceicoccales bacterium]|jgi:hypothetical protein|nr:EscI/YscI/HrpB family type III secretion system inner rod protein [Puniceicoccales bacterium]